MKKKVFLFGFILFILGFLLINSSSVQDSVFDFINARSSGIRISKTDDFYGEVGHSRDAIESAVDDEADLRIDEYSKILVYTAAFTIVFCGFFVMLLSFLHAPLKRQV